MKANHHMNLMSICVILLSSFLVACTEVIDLDVDTVGGQTVVYGRITNGTQGNVIEITRTGLLGQQPTAILGAGVTVRDSQGNEGHYLDIGDGNYEMADNSLVGVPGESYSVRIVLPGGATYESRPEVMPEVSAKDSLYAVIQEIEEGSDQGVVFTRDVVSVYFDTDIFNPRPDLFVKWNVEEVYTFAQAALPTHNFPFYIRETCYIANELEDQRVLLYNGSELRTDAISRQLVTNRSIDQSFRGLHFFNLIQMNLTKGAHQFWAGLDQNSNRSGSIFDQPPGKLNSNLYNVDDPEETVLGYFEVTAVDTARLKVTNREIDRFFSDPCPLNAEVGFARFMCLPCIQRYYEPECLDCLLLKNSSIKRPSYFD